MEIVNKKEDTYYIRFDNNKHLKVKFDKQYNVISVDDADLFFFLQRKAKRIQHQFNVPNIPTEKYFNKYVVKLDLSKNEFKKFITELESIYNLFIKTKNHLTKA